MNETAERTNAAAIAQQAQPRKDAAHVLAFLKRDRTTIDFGDIAHDRETKARARL